MNSPERMPVETHKPFTGYLWGALAVLTCPCHLPILAAVLAGTTAGAFIVEHWGVAALALTGLFALSVARLLRAFNGRSWPLRPAPRFATQREQKELGLAIETDCERFLQSRLSLLERELATVERLAAANELPDAAVTSNGRLKITPLDTPQERR